MFGGHQIPGFWMYEDDCATSPTQESDNNGGVSARMFPPAMSTIFGRRSPSQMLYNNTFCSSINPRDEMTLPSVGDVFEKWRISKVLGEGGYGCIYKVQNEENGEIAAIKIEKARARRPMLKLETMILKRLQGSKHVARFINCGVTQKGWKFLAMELLGANISSIRRKTKEGRFGYSTGLRIARQMLAAIKGLHESCYVHRDIKLSNFAIGLPPNQQRIYIFDFGLARQYCDFDGTIRPPRFPAPFRGTLRYCSPHVLMKKEQDRRDDLISLMYMIAEMLRGPLPWRHCMDRDEVTEIKCSISRNQLLQGLPDHLHTFYTHCFALRYGDAPDYGLLDKQLEHSLRELGCLNDEQFDFENAQITEKQPTIKG